MVSFSGDWEVSLAPLNLINQRRGFPSAGCGMLFNCSLVQSFVLFNLRRIKLCYKGLCFCSRTTPTAPATQIRAPCPIPDTREEEKGSSTCWPACLALSPTHHFHQGCRAGEVLGAKRLAGRVSWAVNRTQEFSRYLARYLFIKCETLETETLMIFVCVRVCNTARSAGTPWGSSHLPAAVGQLKFFRKVPISPNISSFSQVWNFAPESEGLWETTEGFGDRIRAAEKWGPETRAFTLAKGRARAVNPRAAVGLCFHLQPCWVVWRQCAPCNACH